MKTERRLVTDAEARALRTLLRERNGKDFSFTWDEDSRLIDTREELIAALERIEGRLGKHQAMAPQEYWDALEITRAILAQVRGE
jgi:hypothetical protein